MSKMKRAFLPRVQPRNQLFGRKIVPRNLRVPPPRVNFHQFGHRVLQSSSEKTRGLEERRVYKRLLTRGVESSRCVVDNGAGNARRWSQLGPLDEMAARKTSVSRRAAERRRVATVKQHSYRTMISASTSSASRFADGLPATREDKRSPRPENLALSIPARIPIIVLFRTGGTSNSAASHIWRYRRGAPSPLYESALVSLVCKCWTRSYISRLDRERRSKYFGADPMFGEPRHILARDSNLSQTAPEERPSASMIFWPSSPFLSNTRSDLVSAFSSPPPRLPPRSLAILAACFLRKVFGSLQIISTIKETTTLLTCRLVLNFWQCDTA